MPIFKLLITILNIPRCLLHLFFFCIYIKKCKSDVLVGIEHRQYKCCLVIGFLYLLVFDKTYRNLFYYRIGRWKYLIFYWLPPHSSFSIGTYASIGEGMLCIHPFATIINATSIGRNFSVKNNVTIGAHKGGKPIIGNNVSINVNCVIVGNITIGNNVIIGTGSIVMKDVPDNCVVVGNPAYILKQNGILKKTLL